MPTHRPRPALLALCLILAVASCDGGGDDTAVGSAGLRSETIAGGFDLGDGRAATATSVSPMTVAVNAGGDLLIAEYNWTLFRTILRRVDARTGIISTIGGPCGFFTIVDPPTGLCDLPFFSAFAPGDGDEIFVVTDDRRLFRVDAATGALEHLAGRGDHCNDLDGTSLEETCLGYFHDVVRDAAGNLYFSEPDSGVVRRLDAAYTRLEIVAGVQGFRGCLDPFDAAEPIPALQTCLRPRAIALDAGGALLIASYDDGRVDRVDLASGMLTTIVGTPGPCTGTRGDGGPAALACLVEPTSIAAAPDGTVFVAEEGRVRRIDGAAGTITTVVERPFPRRLAVASDGDLVFTDIRRVDRLDSATGTITTVAGNERVALCGVDGEPARDTCIGRPAGLMIDGDDVLFADAANGRIGRIDATGRLRIVADSATVGSCGDVGSHADFCLGNPHDIVRDRDGTLYVADRGTDQEEYDVYYRGRVRRIDPGTGAVTTIAGNCTDGAGSDAAGSCLTQPRTLLLDGHGGLFVGSNDGVQRIDLARGTIRRVTGGNYTYGTDCNAEGIPATDACVDPNDLALDAAGDLYVLDGSSGRIRRIDTTAGTITTFAGGYGQFTPGCTADGPHATDSCLRATAMVIDGRRMIVADEGRLRTIDLATGRIDTVAGVPLACPWEPVDDCVRPTDMELDDRGRLVFTDQVARAIRRVTLP